MQRALPAPTLPGSETIQRLALFEAMLALPRAIGNPPRHQGLGIRKLHASGIGRHGWG